MRSGRTWQMSTIQLDFMMPERFGLTYQGSDVSDTTGDDPPRSVRSVERSSAS